MKAHCTSRPAVPADFAVASIGIGYRSVLYALAALLLLATGAQAELKYVGTYAGSGGQLLVATYTENDDRVGLIGIAAAKRVSVAFGRDEWKSLLALWQKAKGTQSATWKLVGSFKETGTKEETLLTVTAGPSVQFTITDPAGTFSYTLARNNFAAFEANIRQVAEFLAQH